MPPHHLSNASLDSSAEAKASVIESLKEFTALSIDSLLEHLKRYK